MKTAESFFRSCGVMAFRTSCPFSFKNKFVASAGKKKGIFVSMRFQLTAKSLNLSNS